MHYRMAAFHCSLNFPERIWFQISGQAGMKIVNHSQDGILGVTRLIKQTLKLISRFDDPVFAQFQSCLGALDLKTAQALDPCQLPVLSTLDRFMTASLRTSDILASVKAERDQLVWHQTNTIAEFGEEFLENYGWVTLIGPEGIVHTQDMSCALMLLGPQTVYPLALLRRSIHLCSW